MRDLSKHIRKIRGSDMLPVLALLVASFAFFADFVIERVTNGGVSLENVRAAATDVIGDNASYRGDKSAPYTLVEFGDYQCPACRAVNEQLNALIARHHGTVKLTFRNLPLSEIHPLATQAAIIAESARQSNDFWPVHDQLYRGDDSDLGRNCRRLSKFLEDPLHEQKAEDNVANDISEARKLRIHATPTFLLCRPNGNVVRVNGISSLSGSLYADR